MSIWTRSRNHALLSILQHVHRIRRCPWWCFSCTCQPRVSNFGQPLRHAVLWSICHGQNGTQRVSIHVYFWCTIHARTTCSDGSNAVVHLTANVTGFLERKKETSEKLPERKKWPRDLPGFEPETFRLPGECSSDWTTSHMCIWMFCPLFNVSILAVISAWFFHLALASIFVYKYLSVSCHSLFILQCSPWRELHEKLRVLTMSVLFTVL